MQRSTCVAGWLMPIARITCLVCFALLALATVPGLPGSGCGPAQAAPVAVFPISELEPGQRGVALTAFEGSRPDSFAIEIVGLLERSGPKSHVVLLKALDSRVVATGIVQGMSGSPVYVGGRLVGAMAFAYTGALEPIGGATPFEEMQRELEPLFVQGAADHGRRQGAAWEPPVLDPFPHGRANWRRAWDTALASRTGRPAVGAGLAPLALPLAAGTALTAPLTETPATWAGLGLQPVPAGVVAQPGGQAGEEQLANEPLEPGDAFAIDLIRGDMAAAAIGTVTWREGARVLGLGHPFLTASPIELPVSRATIHTIIPTRSVSFKVGAPGAEVGALVADREAGVAVELGRRAPRIPFRLTLRNGARQEAQEVFDFTVADHEILTPVLLAAAARAAVSGSEYTLGAATLAAELDVTLGDGRHLRRADFLRTLDPGQAAVEALAPVAYLAATALAPFAVRAVALELTLHPELYATEVAEVRLPRGQVRPGERLRATVVLRHQMGRDESVHEVDLQIPPQVRGERLVVLAGSPLAFYEWDRERAPEKYRPREFDDLLRFLERYPSEEHLLVRLYGPSRGAVHEGREFASLPLSKWEALVDATSGGKTQPVGGLLLDEVQIPTGRVVLGGVSVAVDVER